MVQRTATMLLALLASAGAPAQEAPPPFGAAPLPRAPDYALAANWAAFGDGRGPAYLVPPGGASPARRPAADVFYVHPTTFRSKTQWNADLNDASTNGWTDKSVVARQASLFNGCCRVFAPRYRQASLAAFSAPIDGEKAYALAFEDVARAFDWYLAHANRGRPIILAGHSQGALMIRRLLAERIRGTAVQRRLVAAYVLGLGIPEGAFGRELAGYAPCDRPTQTGCVLSWNSFVAGSDAAAYRLRSSAAYRREHGSAGARLLCRNPLALGGRMRSLGALPGEPVDGVLQPLVPGKVSAVCEAGVLMVRAAPELGLTPLPGGNLHYHDMSAFYADIRADAIRRARAFQQENRP